MKKTLETLWNDYLVGECAIIDTEEERELAKKAVEKHEIINDLLTKEQNDAIETYIDALCETYDFFAKKAFFKGCEFAASFLIEAAINKKYKW